MQMYRLLSLIAVGLLATGRLPVILAGVPTGCSGTVTNPDCQLTSVWCGECHSGGGCGGAQIVYQSHPQLCLSPGDGECQADGDKVCYRKHNCVGMPVMEALRCTEDGCVPDSGHWCGLCTTDLASYEVSVIPSYKCDKD